MTDTEFLQTVKDHDYCVTGEDRPFFVGRWFQKEIHGKDCMVTTTDGAQLYFLIEGAESFVVDFEIITTMETPYFAYSIDGGTPLRQQITSPVVSLPDTERHLIQIVADGMTEKEGKWILEKGFAIGGILPIPCGKISGVRPTDKVIFFYGDSITEGILSLKGCATSDGNSATHSYPWFCTQALHSIAYFVGYGASGMIQEGSFQPMKVAMDYLSVNRPLQTGDVPDVIVVNHGTNDACLPDDAFEVAARDTLTHLGKKYPGVPIVYMIPFCQAKAAVIRRVMADVENGAVVETEGWNLPMTDVHHPSAVGAKIAGNKLAEQLKVLFGKDFFS